jgi:RHS repeat-associated protein
VYEIVDGGTPYYPLFDGVGSVTALTDAAGAVVGQTRYSAFGLPQATGHADDGFTFTGQQYDGDTGLVFARDRYYDPAIGRFISQDPVPSVNPYAYCLNAPLEFTDPTGREATTEKVKLECATWWEASGGIGFLNKIKALRSASKAGELVVTRGSRTAACVAGQALFRVSEALIPGVADADHLVELVLGGACDNTATNLHVLDSSVNRSIGSTIGNLVRKYDSGTKIILEFGEGCPE